MTYPTRLPRGGVNPPSEIHVPSGSGISNAAVPSRAIIPLLQHAGAPARCLVKPGDVVQEGMRIGQADGAQSAHVHSSIPGVVMDVRRLSLPTGEECEAVEIDLGGSFQRSGKPRSAREWEKASGQEILDWISSAGIVGLGGGLQPTHLKLASRSLEKASLLVANGLDSEPSLSADEALVREKQREIIVGLRICQRLVSAGRVVIAVGEGSEDQAAGLESLAREMGLQAEVVALPSHYPQGHEQLVVAALEGRAPGPMSHATVLNVATLHAVYEAVVLDKPLVERVLTVAGSAVSRPQNLKARIGTRIGELLEECGADLARIGKVVTGGPMRGTQVGSLDLPVTKGTLGVFAFDARDSRRPRELPCIRCGTCIEVCPWGLAPTRLFKLVRGGAVDLAMREGLDRCTGCGCCSYACPSRIPLSAILTEALHG